MWQCSNCSEMIEPEYDRCWNCCAFRDGEPEAGQGDVFRPETSETVRPSFRFTIRFLLFITFCAAVLLAMIVNAPDLAFITVAFFVQFLVLIFLIYIVTRIYGLFHS